MNEQSIKKDYFWNTVGVFLQSAVSPILLIFVARFNGIEKSGLFSFAFSMAITFWMISMWGGRTYQVSDVDKKFKTESYIFSRIVISLFSLIFAIVFILVNNYESDKYLIILILALLKICESIADVFYGVLQSNNKLYISGISLTFKSIIGCILFAIIDIFTNNLILSCLAILAVNMVLLFLYDITFSRKFEKININIDNLKKSKKEIFEVLKVNFNPFVISFLMLLLINILRYFLDIYNKNDIAYFGIFSMPITLIGLLVVMIIQPNVVKISELYAHDEIKSVKKIVVRIMRIIFIIGVLSLIATWLIGVNILNLIFNINIDNHKVSLILMIVGAILNAIVSVYSVIFIIIRKIKIQAIILTVANILLIIACLMIGSRMDLFISSLLFFIFSLIQYVVLTVYFVLWNGNKVLRRDVCQKV